MRSISHRPNRLRTSLGSDFVDAFTESLVIQAFRRALRESGYVEGKDIVIEEHADRVKTTRHHTRDMSTCRHLHTTKRPTLFFQALPPGDSVSSSDRAI